MDFDPNGSMVGGDYYYPIAWIDSTANNQLDLTDDWIPDNILAEPLSEFCRTPIYDGDYIVTFYKNTDFGYKFDAHGATMQVLSDVDRTAFSFDMTPADRRLVRT